MLFSASMVSRNDSSRNAIGGLVVVGCFAVVASIVAAMFAVNYKHRNARRWQRKAQDFSETESLLAHEQTRHDQLQQGYGAVATTQDRSLHVEFIWICGSGHFSWRASWMVQHIYHEIKFSGSRRRAAECVEWCWRHWTRIQLKWCRCRCPEQYFQVQGRTF